MLSIKAFFSQFMWILFISGYVMGCTVNENNPRIGEAKAHYETPDLVVGIMVDQMRPDFIYRYWDKFGDDGFRRLVNEGFSFTNTHFNYMPTATGPGHASVYTGTTPSVHGLIGNSWYRRELGRNANVVFMPGHVGVGSEPDYNGNKGPGSMLTTTFGDELFLHSNHRSKVIGISRKDRGAILPAGHTGDAYWLEAGTGNIITSSYYRNELPGWVQAFNDRNLAAEYLSEPWETLRPIEEYVESMEDDNPYERIFRGQEAPVFPHNLPELKDEIGPAILLRTPFSDKLLLEFAIAAIEGESLGTGPTPDMLAVSFSGPDGVGHLFGPASKEIQDTYLRLDQYLAKLLNYLDEHFGKDNILLFLTSDHGVSHIPEYLVDQGIPGGHFDTSEKMDVLSEHLIDTYGSDFFLAFSNFEIFLDHDAIINSDQDLTSVQKEVARFVLTFDGVAGAMTAETLSSSEFTLGIRNLVQNGFYPKRSGDVLIWLEPHITPGTIARGTTHGSPWVYDTHAPMYWYGWDVSSGQSSHPVYVTDIASTVATFLNSPLPSGNTGNPMNDHMNRK